MSRRVLPRMPWSARHAWSFQATPVLVLCLALVLFGVGEGMLVSANLGASPWTVLAQGLALQSGLGIGTVTFLISAVVFAAWWPLRQRPGLGTLLNMLLIAVALEAFVRRVPPPADWTVRLLLCLGGVALIGIASAFYLTCYLGAGPRDGMMVGLCLRTGWRVGTVRMLMEIAVCLAGWLLGGVVGIGTLLFAFGVGWVVHYALRYLARYEIRLPENRPV